LKETYVNEEGQYTNPILTQVNDQFRQTYIQLVPIIAHSFDNAAAVFGLQKTPVNQVFMSPITTIIRLNNSDAP